MYFRTSLLVAGLAAGAIAQNPESSNSLAFKHGGEITVSYNQVDLGGGETLKTLMSQDGGRMREMWNSRLQARIASKMTLGTTTIIAGNDLDAGTYSLGFRIDDDLVWHLVVMSKQNEEVFATALDVVDEPVESVNRLLIQPMATDNSKGEGKLQIRFGPLAATVPFQAGNAEGLSSEPGGNANADAPAARASISYEGESLVVSYNQLMLAGGRSLKSLLTKGEAGDRTRTYYNNQYLPGRLAGQIKCSTPLSLGDKSVPAGAHRFTFRIDNDLAWHFIVMDDDKDVCSVPLTADRDTKAIADRLIVQPVASSDSQGAGYLAIRYGPLSAKLAFGPGGATSRPSDGK